MCPREAASFRGGISAVGVGNVRGQKSRNGRNGHPEDGVGRKRITWRGTRRS